MCAQELSKSFTLRVLLCHVDVHDNEKPLLDMNKMAVLNDFTFILAWSLQVLEARAQAAVATTAAVVIIAVVALKLPSL